MRQPRRMAMMQVPDLQLTLMMLMLAGLLLLVMHVGVFCRRFVKTDPATVGSGQLLVGSLSLLSLLIGFTFSLSLHRNDQRRDLLLEEPMRSGHSIARCSNWLSPIGQCWRMAFMPMRTAELEFVKARTFDQGEMAARVMAKRERLNQIVVEVVPRSGNNVVQGHILTGTTRLFDAGSRMEAISFSHVPLRVYFMLVFFSSASAFVMGISINDRLKGLLLPAALWCALVAVAMATIVDLDAPHLGTLKTNPRPLEMAVERTAPDISGRQLRHNRSAVWWA